MIEVEFARRFKNFQKVLKVLKNFSLLKLRILNFNLKLFRRILTDVITDPDSNLITIKFLNKNEVTLKVKEKESFELLKDLIISIYEGILALINF